MMLRITWIGLLLGILLPSFGQDLYIKTFGKPTDSAVIYLHGGPGYNSANFESTTAKKLSEKGLFVIVYDRRGEGRSKDSNALFNFQQSIEDLQSIFAKYNLQKASLIGHSFGGMIATVFAQSHPESVSSIILVGAPISLQASFKNILQRCNDIYKQMNDSASLAFLKIVENMDSTSLPYSSMCFRHAMQNKFYTPSTMTQEAQKIYAAYKADTALSKFGGKMTMDAPTGFWKNEHYTTIDLTKNIEDLIKNNVRIFALYGKDDDLYSSHQITALSNLIGSNNLLYLDQCSHIVFMDQQSLFIDKVYSWR